MVQDEFIQYLREKGVLTSDVGPLLEKQQVHVREPIGMIALRHGLIQGWHVDRILQEQRVSKLRFGELAVRLNVLTETQVDALVRIQGFRMINEALEVLVLAGVVGFDKAVEHLVAFLQWRLEAAACGAAAAIG